MTMDRVYDQAHGIQQIHQAPPPQYCNHIYSNIQEHYSEVLIQAILAAKDPLEKHIEQRNEQDILLIDNLCSLFHSFDAFPERMRRKLAHLAILIVIDEKGKELIVHDEELDSFCVLIFGECEQIDENKGRTIGTFHVGDAFGILHPSPEITRSVGYMITKCENCAFLCIRRDDFYAILTDPINYPKKLRHRNRDRSIIGVSYFNESKKTCRLPWSYYSRSFKLLIPDGYSLSRAAEHSLLMALVITYDQIDPDYVEDFILLFRVFMTYDAKDKEKKLPPGMINLCLTLARWLDETEFRDKVIKIILTWLSSYYHDFELNPEFSYLFFRVLESRLMNLSLNNQLHLLHATLSTKSRIRHVTISRSSREQPLMFSIAGGYEKNCGIFITRVHGSICLDDNPLDTLLSYLNINIQQVKNPQNGPRNVNPTIPPRFRTLAGQLNGAARETEQSKTRFSAQLKPGDQILEVNGTNFSAIKLVEAQKKLDMSTHLSLTVKYNPSAFYEMRALPEGRRKSSLSSSISSVSPMTANGQIFTFNKFDVHSGVSKLSGDPWPAGSPLLSANFGFKPIKTAPKNDGSRISNFLINSSKQIVKQIRDSTVSNLAGVETASKASDTISDDQSNDLESGKLRSSSDLALASKNRDKPIEGGLSNMVKPGELNLAALTESPLACGTSNQTLVNVLRVFNAANNDSRYLLVHEETTAREVIMVAVKEFHLTASASQPSPGERTISSLNWHLYEVSVVPESRTIKQKCLSEQTSRLADRASICSRLYIKNNSQSSLGPSKLDMGDDSLVNEILKESPAHVTLVSLNATLLAVELTLADFDKFKSIEPQQFVYDTFFQCSDKQNSKLSNVHTNGSLSSQDTASMKSSSSDGQDITAESTNSTSKTRIVPNEWMQEYRQFADISNREMFWVICEILNEQNIDRRVKIVKQFIRVADVCSQLRNYNSMFAIISGLGHSCITRLRKTFDKLKPKYKEQLIEMQSLFDPSRNMINYRSRLSQTKPPAIPLFPQIKKDLTFTKEGKSIFVQEPNLEFSDDDSELDNETDFEQRSYSQGTIRRKRRSEGDIAGRRSSSTLVNFAEIRKFTERVRDVIYFSSTPYSNDLLTNTKDNQRTQAQIKKMHEEWQMRKRIRHYIYRTLTNIKLDDTKLNQQNSETTISSGESIDQIDGNQQLYLNRTKSASLRHQNGELNITYDEKTLYQRSLEVEPESNPKSQVASSTNRHLTKPYTITQQQLLQQQAIQQRQQQHQELQSTSRLSSSSSASSLQPHLPLPMMINLQPPPILPPASNSSPTLSKSSSLSSCSSFNYNNINAHHHHHQLHHPSNYHIARGGSNMTSSLGKFGTESTESLRKLKALSESIDHN